MINEKYSFKDFMNKNFLDKKASEFNNTIIKGTCFYQESEKDDLDVLKNIFPKGMTGVIFERCNLDNVFIPPNNTIADDCSHRRIQVQDDGDDWEINEDRSTVRNLRGA